jgi:hypothetical protein
MTHQQIRKMVALELKSLRSQPGTPRFDVATSRNQALALNVACCCEYESQHMKQPAANWQWQASRLATKLFQRLQRINEIKKWRN